jgi:hypothetical protein
MQMGWDHPAYVEIMTQYTHFLRSTQQRQAARAVEKQLDQARDFLD